MKEVVLLESGNEQRPRLAGLSLDGLHINPPLGDGIRAAERMRARTLLVPFIGKGVLKTREDPDYVARAIKESALQAERANVLLRLENTLSAGENARILDRIASPAVRVYYDVGNAIDCGGYDAAAENGWLGRTRICRIHLKDRGYLGQGKLLEEPAAGGDGQ